ncbi:hypothetical protein GCM10027456_55690 [Kineosporia babensis]
MPPSGERRLLGLLALPIVLLAAVCAVGSLIADESATRVALRAVFGLCVVLTLITLRVGPGLLRENLTPQTEPRRPTLIQIQPPLIPDESMPYVPQSPVQEPVRSGNELPAVLVATSTRRGLNLVGRQIASLDQIPMDVVGASDSQAAVRRLGELAVQIRRNGESLLVIAGEDPERQMRAPMLLADVIATAANEVENGSRITTVPGAEQTVRAELVPPLTHLLAELLENATSYAFPASGVQVYTEPGTDGVLIRIEDSGPGFSDADLELANQRLRDPEGPVGDEIGSLDLGLFVAGKLARQVPCTIEMARSASGGVCVNIDLPRSVFGASAAEPIRQGQYQAMDAAPGTFASGPEFAHYGDHTDLPEYAGLQGYADVPSAETQWPAFAAAGAMSSSESGFMPEQPGALSAPTGASTPLSLDEPFGANAPLTPDESAPAIPKQARRDGKSQTFFNPIEPVPAQRSGALPPLQLPTPTGPAGAAQFASSDAPMVFGRDPMPGGLKPDPDLPQGHPPVGSSEEQLWAAGAESPSMSAGEPATGAAGLETQDPSGAEVQSQSWAEASEQQSWLGMPQGQSPDLAAPEQSWSEDQLPTEHPSGPSSQEQPGSEEQPWSGTPQVQSPDVVVPEQPWPGVSSDQQLAEEPQGQPWGEPSPNRPQAETPEQSWPDAQDRPSAEQSLGQPSQDQPWSETPDHSWLEAQGQPSVEALPGQSWADVSPAESWAERSPGRPWTEVEPESASAGERGPDAPEASAPMAGGPAFGGRRLDGPEFDGPRLDGPIPEELLPGGFRPDASVPDGQPLDGPLSEGFFPDGSLPDGYGSLSDGFLPDGSLSDGSGSDRYAPDLYGPDPLGLGGIGEPVAGEPIASEPVTGVSWPDEQPFGESLHHQSWTEPVAQSDPLLDGPGFNAFEGRAFEGRAFEDGILEDGATSVESSADPLSHPPHLHHSDEAQAPAPKHFPTRAELRRRRKATEAESAAAMRAGAQAAAQVAQKSEEFATDPEHPPAQASAPSVPGQAPWVREFLERESAGQVSPGQAPINQAPINQAPINQAPADQAPTTPAPGNQAPTDQSAAAQALPKRSRRSAAWRTPTPGQNDPTQAQKAPYPHEISPLERALSRQAREAEQGFGIPAQAGPLDDPHHQNQAEGIQPGSNQPGSNQAGSNGPGSNGPDSNEASSNEPGSNEASGSEAGGIEPGRAEVGHERGSGQLDHPPIPTQATPATAPEAETEQAASADPFGQSTPLPTRPQSRHAASGPIPMVSASRSSLAANSGETTPQRATHVRSMLAGLRSGSEKARRATSAADREGAVPKPRHGHSEEDDNPQL